MPQVAGIRRFGSAALDLAWVAAGRYDGYWELGMKKWDMAAGHAAWCAKRAASSRTPRAASRHVERARSSPATRSCTASCGKWSRTASRAAEGRAAADAAGAPLIAAEPSWRSARCWPFPRRPGHLPARHSTRWPSPADAQGMPHHRAGQPGQRRPAAR